MTLGWAAVVEVLLLCYSESCALPSPSETGAGKQTRSFHERHLVRLLLEAHRSMHMVLTWVNKILGLNSESSPFIDPRVSGFITSIMSMCLLRQKD